MNRKIGFLGGMGVLWLAVPAPPSHAEARLQDYLFEVPVTISNAEPRLVKGSVTCEVEGEVVGANERGGEGLPEFHRVDGSESFLLKGGAYQGRLQVKVTTAYELRQPSYWCRMGLFTADGKNAVECVVKKPENLGRCNPAAWSNLDSESLAGFTSAPLPKTSTTSGRRGIRGAPEVRLAPETRKDPAGIRLKRGD